MDLNWLLSIFFVVLFYIDDWLVLLFWGLVLVLFICNDGEGVWLGYGLGFCWDWYDFGISVVGVL